MENSLDLTRLLQTLKKNLWLLILLPIIFLLLSAILTFFVMKPEYQASSQVLVNQKKDKKDIGVQEVQGNIQLVNTYSEIIQSPRILEEVSKKYDKYSPEKLAKMISVKTQANSQILNLSATNKNKKESEDIANEVAKVFQDEMPKIMNVDNVSILSKANGTGEKISPKLGMNLVGGLLIGLVLALVIIALKEMFDKRIRTEEDIENELGIPVLGSIPKIK